LFVLWFVFLPYLLIRLRAVPVEKEKSSISAHVCAQLFHSEKDGEFRSKTVKCNDVQDEKADFMWEETFEFVYDANGLAFLRYVSRLR